MKVVAENPSVQRATVFIEANPFASRLHVLAPMLKGAVSSGQAVFLCAPDRVGGVDLEDFREGLPRQVIFKEVKTVTPRTPGSRVTFFLLLRLVTTAWKVLRRYKSRTLVLTAIDDYFAAMPLLAVLIRCLFPDTRLVVMRYRVADLLPVPRLAMRQFQKRLVLGLLEKIIGHETGIFDERVPEGERLHVFPDPWSGPFGSITRSEARRRLGWPDHAEVVLLVGGQDERKGFGVAVPALKELRGERPGLRVALIGKVAAPLLPDLDDLKSCYEESFIHVSEYISDEDLAVYFAASSLVLLPYHTAFTSTSGVLVRAAASSTPVVASDHGLVGWRTRQHSLGTTFVYPDASGLCSSIVETLDTCFDPSAGLQFSASCTEEKLSSAFEKMLA